MSSNLAAFLVAHSLTFRYDGAKLQETEQGEEWPNQMPSLLDRLFEQGKS